MKSVSAYCAPHVYTNNEGSNKTDDFSDETKLKHLLEFCQNAIVIHCSFL